MLRYFTGDGIDGYDFAILVLQKEVNLNEMVKIPKLPEANDPCPDEKELISSGWGQTWDNGRKYLPIALHAIGQYCLDPLTKCPKFNGREDILCLGDPKNPENSACWQDGGGTKRISRSNFNFTQK